MAISPPPANGFDFIFDAVPPAADIPADRTENDYRNIGVMLVRDNGKGARLEVNPDPGIETTENPVYGVNLSRGMGFSEHYEPGTYAWGINIDTLTPGVILPGGAITELNIMAGNNVSPIRSAVKFGGSLFFFGGRYPIAVSGGTSANGTFTVDFGSDNVMVELSGAVVWGGEIVVGTAGITGGTTGSMWTTPDGVIWTEHAAANLKARKFKKVFWDAGGQGAMRLIRMQDLQTFSTCAGDPKVAGDWTGTTEIKGIGDITPGCVNIAASSRHIWFCGPSGVWDVDARGYAHNLAPFMEDTYTISNGGACIYYDGAVHVNYGAGIVSVPVDGRLNQVPEHYGPGYGTANGSPIQGYAAPPCTWNGKIIWPIWNPTTNESHIMMAHKDADGIWRWHGSYATFEGIITFCKVDAPAAGLTGETRLWVGTEGTLPPKLFSVSLPFSGSSYQNLINGGVHRFSATSSIYFPDGWNAPTSMRTHYRSDVYADRLDGVAQVGIYASRDHGDYELQGNATSSPRTSFIPMTVEEAAFRLDYRVDLQGTATNPPVLRAFQPLATVKREQIKVWSLLLDVGYGQTMLNESSDVQDPSIVADVLWNLQESPNGPIRISNRRGDIMFGEVLPGLKDSLSENADGAWDHVIPLRIRELWVEWRWDDGVPWDSGRFWS